VHPVTIAHDPTPYFYAHLEFILVVIDLKKSNSADSALIVPIIPAKYMIMFRMLIRVYVIIKYY